MPSSATRSTGGIGSREQSLREKFLQEVYAVLVNHGKRGLSFAELGNRVRRSAFPNAPRFIKLEVVEGISFGVFSNRVYAKEESPRKQTIASFDPIAGFPVAAFLAQNASDSAGTEAAVAVAAITGQAMNSSPKSVREIAANNFYSFLEQDIYLSEQRRSELHNIARDKLKPIYEEWKTKTGLRCGLYYILQQLQRSRRLRYTRQNTMRFKFMQEENRVINLEQAQLDKGGIIIEEFHLPEYIAYNPTSPSPLSIPVVITNTGTVSHTLTKVKVMQHAKSYNHNISVPTVIHPNETRYFILSYQPPGIGNFPSSVSFTFDQNKFAILRVLAPNVTSDPDLYKELKATSPFVRKKRVQRSRVGANGKLAGELPRSASRKFAVDLLSEYELLDSYVESVRKGEVENELVELYERYKAALQERRTADSLETGIKPLREYSQLQEAMLFVEECQMLVDIEQYALENVQLEAIGRSSFYFIEVPGLAEKRPSVLIGDFVEVRLSSHPELAFQGAVWDVELTRIKVKFHEKFSNECYMAGMGVNVFFSFRRTGLKLMHDTLKRMDLGLIRANGRNATSNGKNEVLVQMLFPKELPNNVIATEYSITSYFNRSLNPLQQQAVKQMVANYRQSSTFVLFGPPGTGKTVTLVEAIKQMFKKLKQEKTQAKLGQKNEKWEQSVILVMAPSNYAADLLVDRLSDTITSDKEMFRFMSYARKPSDVASEKVLKYCKLDQETNHFVNPTVHEFFAETTSLTSPVRIIVCTCAMATRLFYYGFEAKHFAAFFIDESGHCWESEAVAGFANLILPAATNHQEDEGGRGKQLLVLAGDPKQLGPIARNPFASMTEFDKSLLERLVDSEQVFQKDFERFPMSDEATYNRGYNPSFIVKLTNCYRCHPEIMKVPNELFYDNDLKSTADPVVTHSCLAWEKLPNKTFPVLFHGCVGRNEQEKSSPSWFNVTEIELVLQYVQEIIQYGERRGILPKDIGIIAPYSSQVKKIRQALNSKLKLSSSEVMVGSCEQFQGQERKVIILSTVRSSLEYLESDEKFNIGFLKNPKRFNVAITRAKALVIVIGNPRVLASDPCWGKLLWFCVDNNSYVGNAPLPTREGDQVATAFDEDAEIDELTELANCLNLNDQDTVVMDETMPDVTDHEFRREE